jgi:hypothetical protein
LICEIICPLNLTGAYNRHGNCVYSGMDYTFTIVCTETIQAWSFLVWQVEYYTSYLEVIKYIPLLCTIKCFLKLFYKHNEIQKDSAHGFFNTSSIMKSVLQWHTYKCMNFILCMWDSGWVNVMSIFMSECCLLVCLQKT